MNQTRSRLTCFPIVPAPLIGLAKRNEQEIHGIQKWKGGGTVENFLFSVIFSKESE